MDSKQPSSSYISNPLELVKPSWEAFKLCWRNLLLLMGSFVLALGAVAIVVALMITISAPLAALVGIALGLPAVIYGAGYFGWAVTKLTIAAAKGKTLSFKAALPTSATEPLKFMATSILAGLAILGGFVLLIIPGLIFIAWFASAAYVVVEEGLWGVAALKRSRELASGRNWDVLGAIMLPSCFGLLAIIPVLGSIAYFFIAIVLTPLFAIRYVQLVELKKRPDWQSVPTNQWVYVVVIVGVIASGASNAQSFSESMKNPSELEKNLQAY